MRVEKREHKRFPAAEEAVVLCASLPGRLLDVSQGGVAVSYSGRENLGEEIEIDLLHTAKNILLEKVRCRKVSDATVGKVQMFSFVTQRRIGLEFLNPEPAMLSMIDHFTEKTRTA